MNVKLISYTKPTKDFYEETNISDLKELIAYCARVSNPSNQNNTETTDKLLRYLIKHQHWSVFEMVNVCLEIETTRDIARQILRHRSFSFQEFCLSGDTEIYFAVPNKLRKGSYAPTQKIKLKDLYDKWANGAVPIPHSHSGAPVRFPLQDRLKKMYIKCFDEATGELTTAHLKEVFATGIKPVYEITLSDGKKIKTTKEHKFLTKSGFESLEEIVGLDFAAGRAVMTNVGKQIAVNGIPVYQDKEWLRQRKEESLFLGGGIPWISEKYGINYNTLRKWIRIHGLQYTKEEVAKTVKPWNKGVFGYSTGKRSLETRLRQRSSALARGENHNWYRGGNSRKREPLNGVYVREFREQKNNTCETCGVNSGKLDLHHIIPVSRAPELSNEISNWKLLCRNCHIDLHRKEDMPGWQAMAARSRKKNAFTVKWKTIEKIEYVGDEHTYDIEVEHSSHNYIANGIVVHNSQRYSDPTKELNFVTREARLQDNKNRQNSIETDDEELSAEWHWRQNELILVATRHYEWAIENGIAKEVARALLPEGLTMSRMYMNGTMRSWIHYIQLRSENGTQKEHMEIAKECAKVLHEIFPFDLT